MLTGVAPLAVAAMAGHALAGVGNGLETVAADTLIQKRVCGQTLAPGLTAVSSPRSDRTLASLVPVYARPDQRRAEGS